MSDKEKFLEFLDSVPAHQRLYPDLYVDQLIEAGATFGKPCVPATQDAGCAFCDPVDKGCLCWQSEEFGVTVELRAGKLTVTTPSGDEVDIPVGHCPACGTRIKKGEAR